VNELHIDPGVVSKPGQLDALLREHAPEDQLAIHLNDGVFDTASTKEWGDTNDVNQNSGFRFGRNWTIDSETGATLRWNVDAVPDEEITDEPRWLIASTEGRFKSIDLSPQECWDLLPRGQRVRGLNFDLQFPKAAERWRAKGKTLRIGAGMLAGHQASWEHCHATNYGALGAENFPFYIQGGLGQYDRNLIAQLDPATHIFDANLPDQKCSHITDCSLDGYATADTDTQVTCGLIQGNIGERSPGEWVQHMRAFAYASRVTARIADPRPNRVQLVTLYQTLRGRVDNCWSDGLSVGYYGDTYSSKGIELLYNAFLNCGYHGVHLPLSPGGPCPEQYSHEDYLIDASNTITSQGMNVMLDTLGPATPTRYIRNIGVDPKFSLGLNGAAVITRSPGAPERKGCRWNPFARFGT
jgi:hypothetical protein